jgi:tRNA (cytidine32/uridine32-2'-O)-methyltransferase
MGWADVSLGNIRIVLVEPQHPGNVGAAARAMKTMGLSALYLVRPVAAFPSYEAERRAAGSTDVLEGAVVTDSLDEATGACRLVVGGTARARTHGHPVLDARSCGRRLVAEASDTAPVAVLFGPERTGLSNDALDRCNFELRIPTSAAFSSLNLAAAVQLLCYEVHMAAHGGEGEGVHEGEGEDTGVQRDEAMDYPTQWDMEYFFKHLERTLDAREFTADARVEVTRAKLRRLVGRARPRSGELKLLHSLVRLMHRERDDEG